MLPGRRYQIKLGTRIVGARVSELKHRLEPESLQPLAAKQLESNDLGEVTLSLDAVVPFAPYAQEPALGGFILIDPLTRATVACGMIRHGLRRADNVHWQALDVDRAARAALKGQHPRCVWFTGLSGAGKSTIANLVEAGLVARGCHTYLLDGDNVRTPQPRLGFTTRPVEPARSPSRQAMTEAGLIVLVTSSRRSAPSARGARAVPQGEFIEVPVDTPLAEASAASPRPLRQARRGDLPNFTGIDSPYEPPNRPNSCRHDHRTPAELAAQVIAGCSAPGSAAS